MAENDWDCERCFKRENCRIYNEMIKDQDDIQGYCKDYEFDLCSKPKLRTTNRTKVYLIVG